MRQEIIYNSVGYYMHGFTICISQFDGEFSRIGSHLGSRSKGQSGIFQWDPEDHILPPYNGHEISGWWLTYPIEKYWSVGMIIPYIMENEKCLKPPTRYDQTV